MNELDQKKMTEAEKYTVLLSVTGRNHAMDSNEELDTIKLMTTGVVVRTEEGWRLDYEETDPENGDKQYVSLDMKGSRVSMQRKGPYGTTMVFEKDRRFEGFYRTPFGDLRMGVYAIRVYWKVEKGQGAVELQYQMDMQGGFSAVHDLSLRFAPNG